GDVANGLGRRLRAVERFEVGGGSRFRTRAGGRWKRQLQPFLDRPDRGEHPVRVLCRAAVHEEHAVRSGGDGDVGPGTADQEDVPATRNRLDLRRLRRKLRRQCTGRNENQRASSPEPRHFTPLAARSSLRAASGYIVAGPPSVTSVGSRYFSPNSLRNG